MASNEKKSVKVRFAPSPTGFLHIGGLRTALYNYLFAKQNNGTFLLRIEDTDKARLVEGAEENIIETLKLFGLDFNEGPHKQSDRLDVYRQHAESLREKDLVYEDEGALRFKMSKEDSTKFTDIIRGEIEIENETQENFVILKSDGWPTYNFAHVVDDHLMDVTHIIRGEEFISSMPKYAALHKAFGWSLPQYAHLPLLLNKQRAKLSKREGDVAVTDFLQKGYLKEALLNFVALLGWHPSKSEQEVFSLEELVDQFKLEEVQKGGAIFHLDKLNWFQHIWAIKIDERAGGNPSTHPLFARISEYFNQNLSTFNVDILKHLWPHVLERLGAPDEYSEVPEEFNFFFEEPEYAAEILVWKKSDAATTKNALEKLKELLQNLPEEKWSGEELENQTKDFIKKSEFDMGTVLWPLRVSLTGREKSMGPFDIMDILNQTNNRQVIFERIDSALSKLQ